MIQQWRDDGLSERYNTVNNIGVPQSLIVECTTNGKSVTLRRPISCLYLLEVLPESDTGLNNTTDEIEMANAVDDSMSCSRPVREAARKSREQIHKWINEQTKF